MAKNLLLRASGFILPFRFLAYKCVCAKNMGAAAGPSAGMGLSANRAFVLTSLVLASVRDKSINAFDCRGRYQRGTQCPHSRCRTTVLGYL